jgi:hypothetical protein
MNTQRSHLNRNKQGPSSSNPKWTWAGELAMKRASVYDSVGRPSVSRFGRRMVVGLCIFSLTCQISCRKTRSEPEPATQSATSAVPLPPDLSGCERIEIRIVPSTVDFVALPTEKALLSPEEIRYLEASSPLIVDDPEVIQTFAKDISSSTYEGPFLGEIAARPKTFFTCYERGGRKIFFNMIPFTPRGSLLMADGHEFTNRGIQWSTLVPQIWPFCLRVSCSYNMEEFYDGLRYDPGSQYYRAERKSYPPASEWYDATVHSYQVEGYTVDVARLHRAISCPSASHGRYHYAMNPDCDLNSPPDTVLLFEARPGRNQHGGPELFTFDNHDPKGGCVLLNDGTVKFIRTEEQLQQLRWK